MSRPAMLFHSPACTCPRIRSLPRSKGALPAPSTPRAKYVSVRQRKRWHGSRKSRRTILARALAYIVCGLAAAILLNGANAQTLVPYKIVGDAIPESLTGAPGDATRGRALVLDRS